MTVSDRQPRVKGLIAKACETTKQYEYASLAYNFVLLLQQLKPF